MPENTLKEQLNPEVNAGLREILFEIESEIRRLQVVVSNLTILTTAPDRGCRTRDARQIRA
ncbi:hypothetical protein [Aminobacter sp. SS-2016]|uniref:hypothetical protein n=1 Tax=Aminobacter sp. Y103A TaxID=1870862 RepID=UPI0025726055|nr:hypothetical protein [Aminobacter sp. SS-2016]